MVDNIESLRRIRAVELSPAQQQEALKGLDNPPYKAVSILSLNAFTNWMEIYGFPNVLNSGYHYALIELSEDVSDDLVHPFFDKLLFKGLTNFFAASFLRTLSPRRADSGYSLIAAFNRRVDAGVTIADIRVFEDSVLRNDGNTPSPSVSVMRSALEEEAPWAMNSVFKDYSYAAISRGFYKEFRMILDSSVDELNEEMEDALGYLDKEYVTTVQTIKESYVSNAYEDALDIWEARIKSELNEGSGDGASKAGEMDIDVEDEPKMTEELLQELTNQGFDETLDLARTPGVPRDHTEMVKSPDREKWQQTMKQEISAMGKNEVYERVPRENATSVLNTRWDYGPGFSAHLTACGQTEDDGSRLCVTVALKFVLALCSLGGLKVTRLRCTDVYSQIPFVSPVYVEAPIGTKQRSKFVWKLKKAIPGLPYSAQMVLDHLNDILQPYQFTQSLVYDCCFFHERCYVVAYGPELLVCSKEPAVISWVAEIVAHSHLQVKRFDNPPEFLGVSLDYVNGGAIKLSLRHSIEELQKQYKITDSHPVPTPMTNESLDAPDSPKLNPQEAVRYKKFVGILLHFAGMVRLDIVCAASRLASYVSEPRQVHRQQLDRTLQYLVSSKSLGVTMSATPVTFPKSLVLNQGEYGTPMSIQFQVLCATDMSSRRIGHIVLLNGVVVDFRNEQMDYLVQSEKDAQYWSLAEGFNDALGHVNMELMDHKWRYIEVCGDSAEAFSDLVNGSDAKRPQKVDLKYHYLEYYMTRKRKARVYLVDRKDNVARIMTTVGDARQHAEWVKKLMT